MIMPLEPIEKAGPAAPANLPYDGPDYPDRAFPVLYADSVYSLAYGNGHVKFYLARLDPSIKGDGTSIFTPFAQVVLPEKAFISAALFFEQQLRRMIQSGAINNADVDTLRASFAP
jgi:hypothetical protein